MLDRGMKRPPVGGNILIWGSGIKRPLFIVCVIILMVFGIMNMAGVFSSADDTKHAIGGALNIGSPVMPAHSTGGTQRSSYALATDQGIGAATDQGIGAALKKVREMWERRLFEIFPEPEGGVLCDLLLGDKKAISGEIKDLYTRNGIAHILSISGLHISILGLGLYSLLRRTGMPIWVCALASGIFLILYGILTGMSVSGRRSIYMFILKLMADSVGRTVDKPTSFALVAVLVLIPDPSIMAECSFLLSFGSAAGIYFLSPLFTKQFDALLNKSDKIALWRRTHKNTKLYSALQWLQNSLIMSLSVTLTILPVTLWFFYEYPVWSILLNLIVLPLMTLLVVSAFLAMLIPGTGLLGTPAYLILRFFERVCSLFDKLPFHSWNPGRPQILFIIIYYSVWMSVVLSPIIMKRLQMKKNVVASTNLSGKVIYPSAKKKLFELCKPCRFLDRFMLFFHHKANSVTFYRLLITMLFLCPLMFVWPKLPGNTLIVMDVGQGDGLIYYSDARDVYLFDGGSSSNNKVGRYVIKDSLKRFGLSHIDAAFVSHPDTDHCSGLIEIMENRDVWGFKIDAVILPGCVEDEMNYDVMNSRGAYRGNANTESIYDVSGLGLHNFYIIRELAESDQFKNKINVSYVCKGDTWKSGANSFYCLHPSKDFHAADPNEMSECFLVEFAGIDGPDLLLTGDIQGAGEAALKEALKDMLSEGVTSPSSNRCLRSLHSRDMPSEGVMCTDSPGSKAYIPSERITILKVAHHGSKYSTPASFLQLTEPQIAIISAGRKNRYGHPHTEVIERLGECNTNILNTQELGSFLLTIKRDRITCRCF